MEGCMAENRLFGRAQPLKERAAKNHIVVDAGFMTGNDQRQKLTRREYMALLDEFQSRQILARDLNRRHMLELGQMQSISALATALVAERCHEVQRAWRYKPHAREGAAYLYSEPLLVDLLRQDTTRLLICRSRRLQMFGIVNRLAIQPHPYSLQLSAYPLIDHKGTFHVQLGSVHKAMAASPDCTVREYEIKVDEHWGDFLSSLKLVEYMQKLHTDEELEMTEPLYLGTVLPWIKALISQDRQDQEVHYRYVLNSLFLNNRLYTDSQIRRVQEMLYGAVRAIQASNLYKPAKTLLQMSLVLASEISDAQADMLHRLQSEHILQIEAPSSMSIREHIACMCQGTYVQIKDKESVYTIYRIVDAERTYVVHHLTPTAVHEGREEKLDAILARLDVTGALKLRGHQGLCATLPRLAAQSWETVVPNGKQAFARATVLWPTVSTVESEVSNALLKYVGGSKMKNCVTDLLMQCMQSAVRWPNFEVDPPRTLGKDGQSIQIGSLQIVVDSVNDCTHACKELLRSARFDVAEDIPSFLSDRVEDALNNALDATRKEDYIEKLKGTLAEWLHYMILVDYVRGGLIGIVLGMERDSVAEAVQQFYDHQVDERTQHIEWMVKLLQSGGCNLIQL